MLVDFIDNGRKVDKIESYFKSNKLVA